VHVRVGREFVTCCGDIPFLPVEGAPAGAKPGRRSWMATD
jgi:hypothetical protein